MFTDYVAQRSYQLWTRKQYTEMLNKVGFTQVVQMVFYKENFMWSQVVVADKTPLMMDMMKMELEKFEKIKDTFVNQFTATDFEDIHQVRHNVKDAITVWSTIEKLWNTKIVCKEWLELLAPGRQNMLDDTGFKYL